MTEKNNIDSFVNKRGGDHSHIKGWGIDANPKNDPTYPMKHRSDEEIKGYTWDRPEQQETDIEVLHSIERPNITAVFGTAAPPSGLSGMIRRYAFSKSESSYGRWLPLVLADRIGIAEGILDDLQHGKLPNIIKERGWKSEWEYNRKNFVLKIATGIAIASATAILLSRSNKK
ncbi:hypothetical protein [Christiangramia sp. OXR-203]|jgi:hypothetical protein|uniref:hypothetical protein n=1 Tax=Christiangramia sp. OXR-203 TaxID=3100176 RepID=UPI002AC9ED2A|nr:hypothetical protein [Christiangramia sp. OXR-203]WPY99312.1 hypothetical protein T8I65_03650 [Christiangramia sp. OXR-203]